MRFQLDEAKWLTTKVKAEWLLIAWASSMKSTIWDNIRFWNLLSVKERISRTLLLSSKQAEFFPATLHSLLNWQPWNVLWLPWAVRELVWWADVRLCIIQQYAFVCWPWEPNWVGTNYFQLKDKMSNLFKFWYQKERACACYIKSRERHRARYDFHLRYAMTTAEFSIWMWKPSQHGSHYMAI